MAPPVGSRRDRAHIAARRARIATMGARGWTVEEIARELNLSPRTVVRHRVFNGQTTPRRPVTEEKKAQIFELRAAGLSYLEVAQKLGIHERSVRRYAPQ